MKPITLHRLSVLVVFALAGLLGSCSAAGILTGLGNGDATTSKSQAFSTAEEVYAHTIINHDPYKGATAVRSPLLDRSLAESHAMLLIAVESTSGARLIEFSVTDCGSNWRNLGRAGDREGNQFPVRVSRRVENWSGTVVCIESVSVELSAEYLEAHRDTGLSIKVWGSAGERLAEFPACYVEGFCRRLAELPGKQAAQGSS